jgi:hypothetical protein
MVDIPHVTHITVVEGRLANYHNIEWIVVILDPYLLTGFTSIREMYEHLRDKNYFAGEFMMTIKHGSFGTINITHENLEEQMAIAFLTL